MQAEMMEKQRVEQAAMAKQAGQALRSVDIFWWDEVRRSGASITM